MALKLIEKAHLQLKDVCDKRSVRATTQDLFSMINRRGIPLPNAIYQHFTKGEVHGNGYHEAFLTQYMWPEPDKCYIDIGANVGEWTQTIGETGYEVYAFEPSPTAFQILSKRMKSLSNVHLYPVALSDQDSTGRLGYTGFSVCGVMDMEVNGIPGAKTINVSVCKLDSFKIPNVGVIKIDTEGYETPILNGAKETITSQKPRLVIEVHKGTGKAASTYVAELQNIKTILEGFGYSWKLEYRQMKRDFQPFVIAKPASIN